MDIPFNLRHLRAVIEIADHGSISAAASAVHLSQPALTQGLNKIETICGTPLFLRDHSGMRLSETGDRFLGRIKAAFGYLSAMDKVVGGEQPRVGNGHRPFHHLLTTTHLRALIAVVENASTSLAAANLNLAQPTVHRAARDVEALSGKVLFTRNAEGVDPTRLARRLARLASLAFSEIQQAVDESSEEKGTNNSRIRIGSLPLARTHLVPAAVTALLQDFPYAQVNIIDGPYEQLLYELLHGHIDILVGALRLPQTVRDIEQQWLFDDELHVVVRAGHPFAGKKSIPLSKLAQLSWVAPRTGTPARQHFQEIFSRFQLPIPEQIVECSSSVATRSLLMQSDRAALLSKRQMTVEIDSKLLSVLDVQLNASRPIGTVVRKNWRPTPVQLKTLHLLKTIAQSYNKSIPL